MLFRALFCCVALVIGLLVSLNAGAEPCDSAGCPAAKPAKPLDIMKFMREQAASTRANEPKLVKKPPQPKHRTVAAQPTPIPAEAATSFAAQPVPEVEVVESDELNAIDRAGEAAPPETVGTAPAVERILDIADAGAADNPTREAEVRPAPPADPVRGAPQTSGEPSSWLEWLWSAFTGTFAALAAAMRQLI